MARGENQRTDGAPMGAAILALFLAVALAALAFVVVTTRACASCQSALYGGLMPSEPYVGATTAAGELGWRDAARARMAWGAGLPPDPAAAAAAVEAALAARGYVAAEGLLVPVARELPFEVEVPALGGGCGVVEVIADLGTRIDGGRAGSVSTTATDASVLALGTCGAAAIRVEGLGRATARVWHLPGLVPADVERTGLPADALLAHAEAERVLSRYGYLATNDLVRVELPARGGASVVAPLPAPSSGCVPWVVVAVGGGRATTGAVSDFAPDRALALAATCATRAGWDVALSSPTGAAATAWARLYRPPGSGAAVPGERPTTAGEARVAPDPASIALPAGLPEAP